jgi:hypothetical protein
VSQRPKVALTQERRLKRLHLGQQGADATDLGRIARRHHDAPGLAVDHGGAGVCHRGAITESNIVWHGLASSVPRTRLGASSTLAIRISI